MRFYEGDAPFGLEVDHRDHDGLNNQYSNLHYVTHRQNQENRRGATGYPGVAWLKRSGKYRAYARVVGKQFSLGMFLTPQEAYEARVKFLQEVAA